LLFLSVFQTLLQKEKIMLANSRLQTIILSSRLPEAAVFYRDTLGLTLREVSDGALVFDVGGSELRVSPVPSTSPSEHTVAGFAVDDVDATVAQLAQQGIEFERFPGFSHDANGILTTPDNSRVAWFRDPDGNLLSVVQFSPT
jgi:catechol 2,3-dioxygenase-like lactoylglutathione lyase family enzyme